MATIEVDAMADGQGGAGEDRRGEARAAAPALDRGTAAEPAPRVSVAVDAAGAAGAFTYHVPADLRPLAAGEAVLVEFGRRQALGIVLGAVPAAAELAGGGEELAGGGEPRPTKPVLGRIRADGPLLPDLSMRLAAWVAHRYLAPPGLTLRSMLPPGMLERLELVAERRPEAADGNDAGEEGSGLEAEDARLLEALATGPRVVRRLDAPEGRPALLRRLRRLAAAGRIDLDWTLLDAAAGPRYVRIARRTNVAVATGTRLGPRQVAALHDLEVAGEAGLAAPAIAERHGGPTLASLVRRGLARIDAKELPRRPLESRPGGSRGSRPAATPLTAEQAAALAAIRSAIAAPDPRPVLLDGVTGGGKTAIYSEALRLAIAAGRPGLVLVPEIALALPLIDRLRADLGARLAILHSGLSDGERSDEWRRIRAGDVDVVVGTRSAVLAPLAEVGLVVVDEEHDGAYKSDRSPRLQARDVAVELGRLAGAAVVLGSATPSVESEGRARAGELTRVRLSTRPSGRPPIVEIVDLRAELAAGVGGMVSRPLAAALDALQAPDQAILVINRRGTASVVLCRDCGHVQACPDCGRPLVYHQAGGTLRCHHCGRAAPLATRCPNCGSARIRYLGGGTERLEREVRDRWPDQRVGRLDRDVVERKGAAARVVDAFTAGELDILVGTSLVTKGLDIPSVTLVGVVSADIALNLPDERATERTYQLLAQAVGRAGRGESPGRALIQTYQPEHPAIAAVASGEPDAFYDAELELRRRFASPPFARLVKLTVALPDRDAAEAAGREMATALRGRLAATGATRASVSGPAPAFIARRADRWRYHVVVRGADPGQLFDEPPGPPWSIDVDPDSLL
ncbi:MAG TPA: primosomal protein N' [Candidatus Limnocylindrales bacterium]|nr:primosomal protein N' [Candidatus Limnocylindrales bacterium]